MAITDKNASKRKLTVNVRRFVCDVYVYDGTKEEGAWKSFWTQAR